MSLSDQRLTSNRASRLRGRLFACSVLLLALPLLAACESGGFRPLYATGPSGVNVNQKLARVDVVTIPSRVGQRIRNDLIFENNGGALPEPPAYRFDVAIRESLLSTLVRQDGESASQIYSLDAKFKLIRLADKKVILEGVSYGRAGFDRFGSIYSNVRAREDAENRAAKTVATDLKGRLAAFLSTES